MVPAYARATMEAMRILIRDKRWLAITLIVLALALRAMVPQGYMPVAHGRVLTVQICADATGIPHQRQIIVPGRPAAPADDRTDHPACAFAGHAMPMLGGADPVLLAAALVFILLVGVAPVAPAPRARAQRLRPPLRAPPIHP